MHQLALFDGLPIPAAIARAKHRARHAKLRRPAQQLAFSFRPRYASQDAEDSDWDFPEHRILSAREAPRVETRAPCSVFDLVTAPIRMPRTASSQAAPLYRIEREDGRTRVISMRHDETDEWAEKERIRRAKQRPPKPVRAAKTIGKKLADLVGAREITTTKA